MSPRKRNQHSHGCCRPALFGRASVHRVSRQQTTTATDLHQNNDGYLTIRFRELRSVRGTESSPIAHSLQRVLLHPLLHFHSTNEVYQRHDRDCSGNRLQHHLASPFKEVTAVIRSAVNAPTSDKTPSPAEVGVSNSEMVLGSPNPSPRDRQAVVVSFAEHVETTTANNLSRKTMARSSAASSCTTKSSYPIAA